ncbi:MAG: glycosyltransferase family 2 protein [Pirellulaceae bacterium]|nr:glycosyltransferase family 2 protein [Pirellulaceae bacterium]
MPKIPSIPRISIVVPIGSDLAAFESTLISVLENRPTGSEILVVHDGQYDDPYQLSDEVRFVIAKSAGVVDLIAAAASSARGRFVHVLAPGFQAVEEWTEKALQKFEHQDVGVIAPVIRSGVRRHVVAAGWHDTSSRLCQRITTPDSQLNRKQSASIQGAYLQASFWRRDLLRSLSAAYQGSQSTLDEASYAYGLLAQQAGWRCVLADDCVVTAEKVNETLDRSSLRRGKKLRAVRKAITGSEKRMPLIANLLRCLFRPTSIGEALGQATYRGALAATTRQVQIERVVAFDDRDVITIPSQKRAADNRRAA